MTIVLGLAFVVSIAALAISARAGHHVRRAVAAAKVADEYARRAEEANQRAAAAYERVRIAEERTRIACERIRQIREASR